MGVDGDRRLCGTFAEREREQVDKGPNEPGVGEEFAMEGITGSTPVTEYSVLRTSALVPAWRLRPPSEIDQVPAYLRGEMAFILIKSQQLPCRPITRPLEQGNCPGGRITTYSTPST